jgi:hypothetical protein
MWGEGRGLIIDLDFLVICKYTHFRIHDHYVLMLQILYTVEPYIIICNNIQLYIFWLTVLIERPGFIQVQDNTTNREVLGAGDVNTGASNVRISWIDKIVIQINFVIKLKY